MRIFKKSLAICLAVVLAVSAMVGCFVSAAELSGTVTASNVEIQSDATSVVVPVEIATTDVAEGTEDAMAIVRLKVTSEIGKLTNVALAEGCSNLVQDVTLLKPEEYVNFEDGIILIEAQSYQKGFTSAKINLTFDVSKKTDDKTTYAVDVLGITDIEGANNNEVGYIFTYNDAVITIAPAVHVHTPGEAVVENNVDATCTTDGSYDTVIYCTECNAEISRTPATVPATNHDPKEAVVENNVDATCDADGSYDSVVYCSKCNAEISRTPATVPATGHSYEWVITTAATNELVNGERQCKCSSCGDVKETQEIDYFGRIVKHDNSAIYLNTTNSRYGKIDIATYAIYVPVKGYKDYLDKLTTATNKSYGTIITGASYYFDNNSTNIKNGWFSTITGMSIADLSIEFTFKAYVQYTDDNGDTYMVYGDTYTATYIDLLNKKLADASGLADTTVATMNKIKTAYDAWIANGNEPITGSYSGGSTVAESVPEKVTSVAGCIAINTTNRRYNTINIDSFAIYVPVKGYKDYLDKLTTVTNKSYGTLISGGGYNFNNNMTTIANGWYSTIEGMAVSDYDVQFVFETYVQYVDASGVLCRDMGETYTASYIDLLNASIDAGKFTVQSEKTLANALLDLYNDWSTYEVATAV